MNVTGAQRAFWARWVLVFGWALVMSIWLDWLLGPVFHPDMYWWGTDLYFPSRYIDYAFRGLTGLDWLDTGSRGLVNLLPFSDWRIPPAYSGPGEFYLGEVLVMLLGLLIALWAFLAGGRGAAKLLPARRRPTGRTVVVTGFMAALLTLAVETLILQESGAWRIFMQANNFYRHPSNTLETEIWLTGAVLLLLNWIVWCAILAVRWQQEQRYWLLERMTWRLLLAGAGVWAVAAVAGALFSGDGMNIEGLGTPYACKAIAIIVILWAWTCRLILLFQLRRFERQSDETICFACGYDLRGTFAAGRKECPECRVKAGEVIA